MAIGRTYAAILNEKGYIPADELGTMADIQQGLQEYKTEQTRGDNQFIVDTTFELHTIKLDHGVNPTSIAPSADIERLGRLIAARKEIAAAQNKKQILLIPTNNGNNHFVVVKITIDVDGATDLELIDSRSAREDLDNQVVLNYAERAARAARCSLDGDYRHITYRGKPPGTTNCPFWVMNYVAQTIDGTDNPEKPLTSNNINVIKKAAIKNMVAPALRDQVQVDSATGEVYLSSRRARPAIAHPLWDDWAKSVNSKKLDDEKYSKEGFVRYGEKNNVIVTKTDQIELDKKLARAIESVDDSQVDTLIKKFSL